MSNSLEVISVTKKDLREAVETNKFWDGSWDGPFSINKARWMLENERSQEEDVLAVIGYENKTLVSFISLFPDWIQSEVGVKKFFWSHRWWIAEKYKDTVLPSYTKKMSLEATNNQIIAKFLGSDTEAYYKKQAFTKFSKRRRYVIIYNLDSNILLNKIKVFHRIKPFLNLIDDFSYKVISVINKNRNRKNIKNLSIDYIDSVDECLWSFVEPYCKNDLVIKTLKYINWQISNSQYRVISNNAEKQNFRCQLGSVSSKIYNTSFVVKKENVIIGFISTFVETNWFTVRYFIINEDYFDDCIDALMNNFIQSKCKSLKTENSYLGEQIKKRYFSVYADAKELFALAHNDIEKDFTNIQIKDQDGLFV